MKAGKTPSSPQNRSPRDYIAEKMKELEETDSHQDGEQDDLSNLTKCHE